MKITIESTQETFSPEINGVTVPTRVWAGLTEGGVRVEVYVLSFVPLGVEDLNKLREEIPSYLRPSRETFTVGLGVVDEDEQ